jgi:transcription initiation factor IIE alpha subunit
MKREHWIPELLRYLATGVTITSKQAANIFGLKPNSTYTVLSALYHGGVLTCEKVSGGQRGHYHVYRKA